ncbi:DUF1385 domain-containing protein [Candidatus Woesearchaeota archaeon]|nr:DUF1385 domain-containing protein [Candidatus Woesearchaeota archaeon]
MKKTSRKNEKKKDSPKAAKENKDKHPELMIGGQAVIEGVMMRTKDRYAVAVRNQKGKIIVKKDKFHSVTANSKLWGLPFIRGMIMLFETLILGVKSLNFSASIDFENKIPSKKDLEKGLIFTMIVSFVFAIALFKFLPLLVATFATRITGDNNILFNLVDGLTKLAILIAYLLAISLMPDVKRLFQYHGAEHKSVACYEAHKKLTVANVKHHKKEHPRCGTSFIIFVIVLSILFYIFIPMNTGFLGKLGLRVLLLPAIAGISYELIRLAGKYDNMITKTLVFPGLLVQRLTTKEPDGKQIEVAIESLKATIGRRDI